MNNLKSINNVLTKMPSSMAGLALAAASLGLCWENMVHLNNLSQLLGAILAGVIVIPLLLTFLLNPARLKQDLQHPVAGSVLPTLAMAIMTIANTIALYNLPIAQLVSWFAISLHLFFLVAFIFYRSKSFYFKQILPSWFIPPIGIVLAVVTHPGGLPAFFANVLLITGLVSYAVLLPIILYRLFFSGPLDGNQKPVIAILATPASLLLVVYLAIENEPNYLLFSTLLMVALLMTAYVYIAFIKLLRLPFSPAYSAFTFPLVAGAIALFRTSQFLLREGVDPKWVTLTMQLGYIELTIASLMLVYVTFRYIQAFWPSIGKTN